MKKNVWLSIKALRNLHLVFFTTVYIYIIGIVFTEDELNGDLGEVSFLCMNTCVLFPMLSLCHYASAPQLPS